MGAVHRALINARDEPLADYRRFRRLHLLLGDSNLLPFANALKVGTTALMLDLLEADALPDIALYEPVCAMRRLSHQPNGPWKVQMADKSEKSALDLLEQFLEAATSGKIELDADGKWTVEAWRFALDKLRQDPLALVGKLDWITKHYLLDAFVKSEGITWRDTWLESLDLEYHSVDPTKSLLAGLPGTSLVDLKLPGLAKRDFFIQPPAEHAREPAQRGDADDPAQAAELRDRLGSDLHRRGEADSPRRSVRARPADAEFVPDAGASVEVALTSN